jgi:adenylate cyclase
VEEGLGWADRALVIDPEDAGVRYNAACLFAVAGRHERALDCLEEARDVGFGNKAWLERDPDLEGLRRHPRFKEILAEM